MYTFKQWLLEGGNIVIDGKAADRIDLTKLDRSEVVSEILKGLNVINQLFQKKHGLPIWSDEILKDKSFLSGSSFHFFATDKISNQEFIKNKPLVGDIDTRVDIEIKDIVLNFLKSISIGTTIDNLIFRGFKQIPNQFITLWTIPKFGINVQIDLELVDFINGKPTAWSLFSHSSSWDDIKEGIKGVFHKYILRSLPAIDKIEIVIQPATSRGKEKIVSSAITTFSLKGLREKLKPVLDADGKQIYKNSLPVYMEVSRKDISHITDLDILFSFLFKKQATKDDLEQMNSFIGCVYLLKKHLSKTDQNKVVDRFVEILWGPDSQGLVRGNPTEDFDTKKKALDKMLNILDLTFKNEYQNLCDIYYKNYKS